MTHAAANSRRQPASGSVAGPAARCGCVVPTVRRRQHTSVPGPSLAAGAGQVQTKQREKLPADQTAGGAEVALQMLDVTRTGLDLGNGENRVLFMRLHIKKKKKRKKKKVRQAVSFHESEIWRKKRGKKKKCTKQTLPSVRRCKWTAKDETNCLFC